MIQDRGKQAVLGGCVSSVSCVCVCDGCDIAMQVTEAFWWIPSKRAQRKRPFCSVASSLSIERARLGEEFKQPPQGDKWEYLAVIRGEIRVCWMPMVIMARLMVASSLKFSFTVEGRGSSELAGAPDVHYRMRRHGWMAWMAWMSLALLSQAIR